MENNNQKDYPLSNMDDITKWLEDAIGCIHCAHLERNDKPIHEKKCTNPIALAPSETYPNGIETDKSWLRQDELNRQLHGESFNNQEDVNEYFMCEHFKYIAEDETK